MFLFVLGIILAIVGLVAIVVGAKFSKKEYYQKAGRGAVIGGIVGIVLCFVFILWSFVVTLSPGQVGIAYQLNGARSDLKVGYNFVAPWAKIHVWDTTIQVITFSEGEAKDDIYGAQTTEKDYITVVATIGVHIDTDRMDNYIALYGNEQVRSDRIMKLLKTVSRNSIESVIGSYKTAEVMENKKKIGEQAGEHFKGSVSQLPIVIDSFTIDDLVAPESYENAIREQAQLRMNREKATLQQQVNEQEATANRIKAEGEAAVAKTNAEAQATVKRIEAENTAEVKKIEAENAAQVAKIKAENDAEVKKVQAEADASVKVTQANANAEATVKQGEAEATAIKAQGEAYKQNPQLIDLKVKEIEADVQAKWAEHWSGYSFDGIGGFTFTNLSDLLKGIIPGFSEPAPVAAAQ
ncbi:MAG: hypothetical protein IKI57_00540 [Clostridia bacterium]|nr:hypothetical protein [Clostridia bacterium]